MSASPTEHRCPTVSVDQRRDAPEWALLQRYLIDALNEAAERFVARYTRPDGTLVWRDDWPGMDGSDDAYEAFQSLPLLYALGGSEAAHALARKEWEAVTWQWTQYGQVHREFDAYYDWMHHGESSLLLYYLGLSGAVSLQDVQRARRFADLYTGDDPHAANYDPRRRLMRSPLNGSRGPRFEVTAEDWSTHRTDLDKYPPPFDDLPGVTGPKCPWTDDTVYAAILERFNARMTRGDIPMNLTATSLVAHAYLYTGERRYRDWIMDYLAAWEERTERNGGITPDNVGLSGEIGETMDGRWWGGYYGWQWPHGAMNLLEGTIIAGCNAVLMDGDPRHLDLARSQLDHLWERGRQVDGRWQVPHRHTSAGWSDFRPLNPNLVIACWNTSQSADDLERVTRLGLLDDPARLRATTRVSKGNIGNVAPWFAYVQGRTPDYPEAILRANLELMCRRLEQIAADDGDPADWNIHHWQQLDPVVCEGLVQLTMGAPMPVYHGGLLHARLRYYDAEARRPGLPPSVAALVESIDGDGVTVSLVNLDPHSAREVLLQAGAFGEHRFDEAVVVGDGREPVAVGGSLLSLRLGGGAGARLRLRTTRFANRPSYATPWTPMERFPTAISPRPGLEP